ncbi:MAG: hypothetical protein NTZ05_00140, partial [Chloroflexi bacterium]|nr:hypothetical protein [Chloroflexota bacterium]
MTTGLKLGEKIGTYTVKATSGTLAPVSLTATATAGPVFTLEAVDGTGQTASIGSVLPTSLKVLAKDVRLNPVKNAAVTFALGVVPGSAVGQTLFPATPVMTGVNGFASVQLTLGNKAGTYNISATSGAGSAAFSAEATAGAAGALAVTGGNNQTGVVATTLPSNLQVKVLDSAGNIVTSGVSVTFTITPPTNSALVGGAATATVTSNASGIAEAPFKLGQTVGTYTVT